jgi:hypothetical protein
MKPNMECDDRPYSGLMLAPVKLLTRVGPVAVPSRPVGLQWARSAPSRSSKPRLTFCEGVARPRSLNSRGLSRHSEMPCNLLMPLRPNFADFSECALMQRANRSVLQTVGPAEGEGDHEAPP